MRVAVLLVAICALLAGNGSCFIVARDTSAAATEGVDVTVALEESANTEPELPGHSQGEAEIARYEQIVQREPDNVDALLKFAGLLYAYHRSSEAVPLWKKAISLDAGRAEPPWQLGVFYGQRGDDDAAEAEYLAGLRIDPSSHYRANLAVIYATRGALDAAESEYRTLLRLHADETAWIHHSLGTILAQKRRWVEALEHYRLGRDDRDSRSALGEAIDRLDLAEALRHTGSLDEAEQEVAKAQQFLNLRVRAIDGRHSSWRHPPASWTARGYFEQGCNLAERHRLSESVSSFRSAIAHDSSLLEKIEASDELAKVRATADYKKLAAAVGAARRESAPLQLEARFTATIKWVEILGKREARAAFMDHDARWLVAVEIASIEKSSPLFDRTAEVILAVHSPARLLARSGESAAGKSYRFRLGGEIRQGKPVYDWIRADESTRE